MDKNNCAFAGPGRGDCENYIGLPGKAIPGQHDGEDNTVDVYGKPNGWCWFCWHTYQIRKLQVELYEANKTIEKYRNIIAKPLMEQGILT